MIAILSTYGLIYDKQALSKLGKLAIATQYYYEILLSQGKS